MLYHYDHRSRVELVLALFQAFKVGKNNLVNSTRVGDLVWDSWQKSGTVAVKLLIQCTFRAFVDIFEPKLRRFSLKQVLIQSNGSQANYKKFDLLIFQQ